MVNSTSQYVEMLAYSHPCHVRASLDKMNRVNHSCLMESDKQQITEVRSKTEADNSETQSIPKRISPMNSASVAFL